VERATGNCARLETECPQGRAGSNPFETRARSESPVEKILSPALKFKMAKKFEFLPHPADEYIVGYGRDLKEAYQNLALGLNEFMVPLKEVKLKVTKNIEVESEDKAALAFDFLTEFLILHDSENLVFGDVKVTSLEETSKGFKLKATASGEEFDPQKHHQGTAIKAITYHNLEIKEKPTVSIKILVDI